MSDWDGRPQNPEQSGMHLLRSRLTGHLTGWYWNAATERFHHEHITLGRTALLERYVYEGPILTPAEVAALVEAARREGAAKERKEGAADLEWKARGYDGYGCKVMLEGAAAIRARGDA
jgi:hypothetical protein